MNLAGNNLKFISFVIAIICVAPILLIFGGWVWPFSVAASENWEHIKSTVLASYILGSISVMVLVAFLSGSIGAITAWCIARYNFPLRGVLSWMLILPFAMPSYILAMSYGHLLEFAGPVQSAIRDLFEIGKGDYVFPQIRSSYGAAFILSLATFPYVYLLSRSAFEAQSNEWSQLASVFGRDTWLNTLKMSFGAARPFMAIGISLAIIEAAADIGVTQLFGVQTLATGLYRQWYFGDDPLVAARLASILILIAGFLLVIERASRKRAQFNSNIVDKIPRQDMRGIRAWLMCFLITLPVLLGFFIPLFWTIRMAIFNTRHLRIERVWDAAIDSIYVSAIGAGIVVLAAIIMSSAERNEKGIRYHIVASLGYAVPGLVIALGLLIFQRLLLEGMGWRLVMTGSIFGMLIAYLVRFFSPAYQTIHSGFARISPEMDMMASGFGKSKWAIWRQIHMPLLRTPVFYALLLVAIDIFKELPATLILRPFDIKTLAIVVFEFAGDDRPAEAAPYALILIAIALIAVYLLAKLNKEPDDKFNS